MTEIHYTYRDNHNVATESDDKNLVLTNPDDFKFAVAKTTKVNDRTKHYIKILRNGKFDNPYNDQGAVGHSRSDRILHRDGSSRLVEVNEECFKYYLKFLETRNVMYLKHAETSRF